MADAHEYLFSYGTLQQEEVQQATFGRTLSGKPDVLAGYALIHLTIKDTAVIETSGSASHPIIQKTGNKSDTVMGTLFEVTPNELTSADFYEVDDYRRVSVVLASGLTTWVYVDARDVASDRDVSLR
jgi:Gamma-glutamyl cyclotransferase, AIG2-like